MLTNFKTVLLGGSPAWPSLLEKAREYNLQHHVKSIHENHRYHCDLCNYTTTRTNYLKAHIKVFHNNPSK